MACEQCRTTYTIGIKYSTRKRNDPTGYKKRLCLPCRILLRKALSRNMGGEANPNWKGGYKGKAFYSSKEWKELRTKVFVRDNYTCRDCNKRGGQLEANHIKARSRYPDLKLVESNVETLCRPCHNKKMWMVYI